MSKSNTYLQFQGLVAPTEFIIIGTSGFGLEVREYLEDCLEQDGYTAKITQRDLFENDEFECLENQAFIIAISNPMLRQSIAQRIQSHGGKFFTIQHPLAKVFKTAKIELGSIIAPFAFVGPKSKVGKFVIMNCYTCVGHEGVLEEFSTLNPYAFVAGCSKLSAGVFMGSHSLVSQGLEIGRNTKIGAGAVCLKSSGDNLLLVGIPAKDKNNI